MTSPKVILKDFLRRIRKFVFTEDFLIFLVFVLISTAFWFVNMSGKKRAIDMNINIEYKNIPDDIQFLTPLPKEINVKIKDFGLNVLQYIFQKQHSVIVNYNDFLKKDSALQYPEYKLETQLKANFKNSAEIVSGLKKIIVQYQKLEKKRLATMLIGEVFLQTQYIFLSPLRITPDSINVFGPKEILDTLRYAYVAPLTISKIDKSVSLKQPFLEQKGIFYTEKEATIDIAVEMLTEKHLQIPIQCINKPLGVYVHLFPSVVDVIFSVGLSNFYNVTEDDFQAVLDYNQLKSNISGKQLVTILSAKDFIRYLKVQPQEVEFLLEEN